MADVFLSYKREDKAATQAIAEELRALGLSVFFDVGIEVGDKWDEVIERELEQARCVVVLWSPAARTSQWVRIEAREALRRGVLCPAIIETCTPPVEFSGVQAAELIDSGDDDARYVEWCKLVAGIERCTRKELMPKLADRARAAGLPRFRRRRGVIGPSLNRFQVVTGLIALAVLAGVTAWPLLKGQAPTALLPRGDLPVTQFTSPRTLPNCLQLDNSNFTTCRLVSTDFSRIVFEIEPRRTAEGGISHFEIKVIAGDHSVLPTVYENADLLGWESPKLVDLDGDHRDDLLVPLGYTGNAGKYAIWIRPPGRPDFKFFGQVTGDPHRTASGYISTETAEAANIRWVTFHHFDREQIKPVVAVRVVALGRPDAITGVDCEIENRDGLQAEHLTLDEARIRFCAEPVVTDLFK